MNTYEEKLMELIRPLFEEYGYQIYKATLEELQKFENVALANGVSKKAIWELKRFYNITNGIPCVDIDLFKCDSANLYEFWNEQRRLWIGTKDMDIISWKDDKFHLGSAGNLNYGNEYVFESLLELIRKGIKEWYPETNGAFPINRDKK